MTQPTPPATVRPRQPAADLAQWRASLKPGDRAMVEIVAGVDSPGDVLVGAGIHTPSSVRIAALHPLPPAMTGEERAVIEAAEQLPAYAGGNNKWANAYAELLVRCEALRASRQPPDPLRELREAWDAMRIKNSGEKSMRLELAIAAMEAAR